MGDDILVCSVGWGREDFKICKQILFEILDVKCNLKSDKYFRDDS